MKKKIYLGISISLICFGILFFNLDGNEKSTTNKSSYQSLRDPYLVFTEDTSAYGNSETNVANDFSVDIEQVIQDYSEWSIYPPDSRPLKTSHVDVLEPRVIPVSVQEMPVLESGKIKKSGYSCHMQPEYHTVVEGQNLRIFLSCYITGTDKKQKISIETTKLEGRAGKNLFYPPNLSGNDSGFEGDKSAGDLIYTFLFRPRTTDWGDMSFTVQFFINGESSKNKHSLTHHFFSSPIAPAKFTGKFSDRIEDGSMFVDVELQVIEPGNYTIEANLMTDTGEPVGYARKDKKLNGGKQIVTLEYFGKVIVSARESGPYQLTNIRGILNTDVIQEDLLTKSPAEVDKLLNKIVDDRPKHKTIPYFEGVYATNAYNLNEFSDREYDSPEKRQRIADLKMLRK